MNIIILLFSFYFFNLSASITEEFSNHKRASCKTRKSYEHDENSSDNEGNFSAKRGQLTDACKLKRASTKQQKLKVELLELFQSPVHSKLDSNQIKRDFSRTESENSESSTFSTEPGQRQGVFFRAISENPFSPTKTTDSSDMRSITDESVSAISIECPEVNFTDQPSDMDTLLANNGSARIRSHSCPLVKDSPSQNSSREFSAEKMMATIKQNVFFNIRNPQKDNSDKSEESDIESIGSLENLKSEKSDVMNVSDYEAEQDLAAAEELEALFQRSSFMNTSN